MASPILTVTIPNMVRKYRFVLAATMPLFFSAVAMGASCQSTWPWSSEQAALIAQIQNAFSKNCSFRSEPESCVLLERDVFPQSLHPNHVLLFRGEPQDRLIGQSALFAFAQKRPRLCKAPCTEQNVLEQFQRALAKMPEEAPGSLCKDASKATAAFRIDLDRWIESRPDIRCEGSPLLVVGRDHIRSGHRFRIEEGTTPEEAFPFDPFISLSFDPNVSLRFANLTSCNPGRLIVLSVDKTRVPGTATQDSDVEMTKGLKLGTYVRFSAAQHGTFEHEREIDAIVRIPPGDFKVVLAPHLKMIIRK